MRERKRECERERNVGMMMNDMTILGEKSVRDEACKVPRGRDSSVRSRREQDTSPFLRKLTQQL